ncbi:pyridoxamine 5'-phosphate oxidase-related, FMN-binding [Alkaliphilus metalliredigens QYMF]|uniref:Pyridoxamine 5'-phosphate oxidase-related, FMN-binding n=1 Tax=Alkaliphilus metalliredigens (strain QYMF) TaxID=293826 RepID=A6TST3_ALKMQ|nr:pyridoxamine 5'-phosphate oxidase family protein [Alkaliphilus metalliredigens]ABR49251.1 pyridoxamine 5'-phosphate oxidase-related, FMN-binding [Alkaliphilus metalliredigens QYMF]
MDHKMAPLELRDHIIGFLKENKDGALGTCMNNVPRTSPVQYFLGEELDLYILSAGGDKFNAIKDNPNVCLLVNTDYLDHRKIKGIQVFGKATTSLHEKSLQQEAMKFVPNPHLMDQRIKDLNVIKIVPEEIVYLDALETGDRTKQILRHQQVVIKEDQLTPIH